MEKETKKIVLPDGWEIDKVEGNEIILKEAKKELPKTWEECYTKLGIGEFFNNTCYIYNNVILDEPRESNRNTLPTGLSKPILALCQLLVCREVYRQGWKPNWKNRTNKPCICYIHDQITPSGTTCTSSILSFQSREIRDKFLENFRNLIEEAKELI